MRQENPEKVKFEYFSRQHASNYNFAFLHHVLPSSGQTCINISTIPNVRNTLLAYAPARRK